MARRRLTPAKPGYLTPSPSATRTRDAGVPPIAQISGHSAEAAALQELTAGLQAARDEGRMIVEIPLKEIAPGHLVRDRMTLELEALEELKASISLHGQRVPAEITPLDPTEAAAAYRFGLISGWRRLRALSELYDETGDPRFSTLRALVRPAGSAADSYVAMIEENEIRIGLSYYERARVVAETTQMGVFPDHTTALRTLFAGASRAKRSKIGSFVELHGALGDVLSFPADIPERLGLSIVSKLRETGVDAFRAPLQTAAPSTAKAEIDLLAQLSRPSSPTVSRAKHDVDLLAPGLSLTIERKAKKINLTLSGDKVDDALLLRVRQILGQLT